MGSDSYYKCLPVQDAFDDNTHLVFVVFVFVVVVVVVALHENIDASQRGTKNAELLPR